MNILAATLLVIALSAGHVSAAEVDEPPPPPLSPQYRVPRGYLPPPPRYVEPAPRARLGDLCEIEARSGIRTCDLRRPAPLGSFCECITPSGRAREGRVVR
jgi:hypothetical protein